MQNIEVDPCQHVALAVIQRNNYFLISKRAHNTHQGSLWEFPGGKVESDETIFQALFKELHEELGIIIEQAEPLISIPFSYPPDNNQQITINVLLDVWIVSSFSGQPFSKENQLIKWVTLKQLTTIEFPAANQYIIKALLLPDSYVISPDVDILDVNSRQCFIHQFTELCRQGYSLIQLRFKKHIPRDNVIQELVRIADNYHVNLQFNSAANINNILDCARCGIHLTSVDLHSSRLSGLRKMFCGYFSASCHNQTDVLKANKLQLDFIVISPVKKTTSHPAAKPIGWESFERLVKLAQMPVYALGGMKAEHIHQAKQSGAQGIAAISEFWKTTAEKEH